MAAKRPPALKQKAYIEIDLDSLKATGEIVHIGEPIIAPEITTKIPRGSFEITYTAELLGILERLGNKKIQVFSYLLDSKDGNNSLNTSIREIAARTHTSLQTVSDTIKILREAGLISRKGSVYMLSPGLMVKGSQVREAYLMRRYIEMEAGETADKPKYIDMVMDDQMEILDTDMTIGQRVRPESNNR